MSEMDPDKITFETPAKAFAYERIARELDACEEVEKLRAAAKCFLKLHMKTQEMMKQI